MYMHFTVKAASLNHCTNNDQTLRIADCVLFVYMYRFSMDQLRHLNTHHKGHTTHKTAVVYKQSGRRISFSFLLWGPSRNTSQLTSTL